jgi:hypothetical protein
MTDEPGNKSWASRQFHLELFPSEFGHLGNPNPVVKIHMYSQDACSAYLYKSFVKGYGVFAGLRYTTLLFKEFVQKNL